MRPEHVGVLVEGVIPFLAGIYVTLLAFRVIGPRPGVKPKRDDWHRRWGGFLRVCGPVMVMFAFFIWVRGGMDLPNPAAVPPTTWIRHKTADGIASVEFPGVPQPTSKLAEGVETQSLNFSIEGEDCYLILSTSVIPEEPGVSDLDRMNGLKETIPTQSAKLGKPLSYFSEEVITVGGLPARDLRFVSAGSKYTLQMRVVIVNGRLYRAVATSRTGWNDGEVRRFINSFKIEKGGK